MKDGGPAFPQALIQNDAGVNVPAAYAPDASGMSLRDYFAGQALAGLLANPKRYEYIASKVESGELTQEAASAKNAHKAYRVADAMIAEREAQR